MKFTFRLIVVTLAVVAPTGPILAQQGPLARPQVTVTPARQDPATSEVTTHVTAGATASNTFGGGDSNGGGAVFGLRHNGRNYRVTGHFNFANPQTITGGREAVGSSLLNPGSESRSFNFSLTYVALQVAQGGSAAPIVSAVLYSRLGVASLDWRGDVDRAGTIVTQTVGGAVISPSFGMQFLGPSMGSATQHFQFGAELGVTGRWLAGNIAQEDEFRRQVTGSTRTFFWGPEATVFMRMGDFAPYVRLTYIPAGTHMRNFSGSQVTFGVDVLTNLFQVQ